MMVKIGVQFNTSQNITIFY